MVAKELQAKLSLRIEQCATAISKIIGKRCPICKTTFTPHRPEQICCSHSCRGEKTKGTLRNWLVEEVVLIAKYYPDTGTKMLRDLLPRSIRQIQKKARHLGIQKSDNRAEIESRIAEIRRKKYEQK